jgi:hypothetical protein
MQLNRCFYQLCNPWETGHVRNILEIDSCTWFGCRFTCRDAQKQGAAKRRGCRRKKLILSIDDTWNNNDLRGWLVRTRQDIFFPTRSHSHQSGFFMLYRGKVVHDLNFFFLLLLLLLQAPTWAAPVQQRLKSSRHGSGQRTVYQRERPE